jgi:hypothetical protein
MIRRLSLPALVLVAGSAAAQAPVANDYPTSVRAEYVFGCMAVNGQTREALERCSCSIDVIASVLSYDDYVSAEAVLSLRLMEGDRAGLFRNTQLASNAVATLRRAQAEAEVLCF